MKLLFQQQKSEDFDMNNYMYFVYWINSGDGSHCPQGICDTEDKAVKMVNDLKEIFPAGSVYEKLPYNHIDVDGNIRQY